MNQENVCVQFDEPKERRNEMEAEIERFLDELSELTDEAKASKEFKEWLDVQSRFHSYSPNNSLLIKIQNPNASNVAGFKRWKNEFDRYVKSGETAIWIWAPMMNKVCSDCGKIKRYHNKKSCPKWKESSVKNVEFDWETVLRGFRPVPVFDVSQTEGEPLPELDTRAKGDAVDIIPALKYAAEELDIDLKIVDPEEWDSNAKGYAIENKARVLKREDAATASTIIHELAHIVAGHTGRSTLIEGKHDRSHKEIVAESVAYIVGKNYGLDMENSKFYLAAWKGDKDKIDEGLKAIANTSKEIIRCVDPKLTGK